MRKKDWVHLQPILQTDRRIPKELGVGRWGCAWRISLAAAEYFSQVELEIPDIIMLHHEHMKLKYLKDLPLTSDPTDFQVVSFERCLTHALDFTGAEEIGWHIGNATQYLGYRRPWRVDFCFLHVDTGKADGHWRLGDADGILLWDPDPAVEGELDGHMLKFRIGEK